MVTAAADIVGKESAELRQSYSMPTRDENNSPSPLSSSKLRHSKSDDILNHKLDRYGFILNIDSRGKVVQQGGNNNSNGGVDATDSPTDAANDNTITTMNVLNQAVLTFAEAEVVARRTKKWQSMLKNWTTVQNRRQKLVKRRLRKGIPDAQRGAVWLVLGNVHDKIKDNPGTYQDLVQKAIGKNQEEIEIVDLKHTKSFKSIQDIIERDIHRTFPRHSMFYQSDEDVSVGGGDDDDDFQNNNFCSASEMATAVLHRDSGEEHTDTPEDAMDGETGQHRLRRLLKAYSIYDREIGYCQGMNFIAAMFLTLMTEEQAFWMLVCKYNAVCLDRGLYFTLIGTDLCEFSLSSTAAVMYDRPCRMRGLFGEGMRETHQVLYVAEKLIHQFLPKLAKHFDNETIHVTMFATQWLLTQYTSSFKFDLVTRVWDCFLFEGWKITYRVMLSLLQHSQATLLAMSFEEILAYFRDLPSRIESGARIVDDSIKIPLRTSHINKYEKEWRLKQQKEQQQAALP